MSKKVLIKKELIDIMNLDYCILKYTTWSKSIHQKYKIGEKSENSKENNNNYNHGNIM